MAQACTIVLPSDGAFDSRAWRIAGSLSARGHRVTVLARSAPGLADREEHPGGYAVIRVPVSARTGLPAPLGWIADRFVPAGRSTASPVVRDGAAEGDDDRSAPPVRAAASSWLPSALAAARRLLAIALTVRSQRLASRPVAPPADLVHAMAYMGIPVGLALGRRDRVPVVYDARDIYVEARNIARLPAPARRLFGMVERRWARQASRVMTVNQAYAEEMAVRFGLGLPAVVMNCPYRPPSAPHRPRRFHERLGLAATDPVVLYHGGLAEERGIDQLIAALPSVPEDAHLVLLGYGPRAAELAAEAERPVHGGRLHVLPAVPPAELIEWVASADVAVMPIQPGTLNHRLTTPNKLFEAMTAGTPVVAADLPGMASIVREAGCGVLCDPTDPAAVAAAIRSILDAPSPERMAYGERGLAAARGKYSWETQFEVLLAEYGHLTGQPW